jgi:hypothetical protein
MSPNLIVCPLKACVPMPPIEGSMTCVCCACKRELWISPASLQVATVNACDPICIACYLSVNMGSGDVEVATPSDGQAAEITAANNKERN